MGLEEVMNWLPILPLLALLIFTPPRLPLVPTYLEAWGDPNDGREATYIRVPGACGVSFDETSRGVVIIDYCP